MTRPPRLKVCAQPGCPELTATSRCDQHKPAPWQHSTGHDRTSTAEWKRTVTRIRRRDHDTCYICGQTETRFANREDRNAKTEGRNVKIEVDHIVPVFEGGTDDDTNLATICQPCHRTKTAAEGVAARRHVT